MVIGLVWDSGVSRPRWTRNIACHTGTTTSSEKNNLNAINELFFREDVQSLP
jgi:hypothetical protein